MRQAYTASAHRIKCIWPVPVVIVARWSRAISPRLLWRGAGQVRYKGLAGAVVQQGMTVMAHNGAVVVRIRQQQLSKRARKFRRLLGLKPPKVNKISELKN